ncbi:hypothetical protein RRG08_055610 [Elysia crispata]|uniref:Uncharacterized protein n=1 Tax=Elysia crispata TaxID=231223 RepID=A0AAE1A189_9GAST|nr:hypothetical protein RRG08_055610 [Elysia crispata]
MHVDQSKRYEGYWRRGVSGQPPNSCAKRSLFFTVNRSVLSPGALLDTSSSSDYDIVIRHPTEIAERRDRGLPKISRDNTKEYGWAEWNLVPSDDRVNGKALGNYVTNVLMPIEE